MKITLLNGQIKGYDSPMSVLDIAADIAVSMKKKCLGAIINNEKIMPNGTIIDKDCKLELITERHALYRSIINYTAKIIVSAALKKVFPDGEIINYNDNLNDFEFSSYFNRSEGIKFEDLKKIEATANEFIKEGIIFEYIVNNKKTYNEILKLAKIKVDNKIYNKLLEIKEQYIKYPIVSFNENIFLSEYSLLPSSSNLYSIELTQLTGVYLDGDKKNQMVYKIHGLAEVSEQRMQKLKADIEEMKLTDHKYIAKNLEIYHLDPLIGSGLPIWLPNGAVLKQEIKKYLMQKEFEYDFIQIETPVIGTTELYKISGHWEHYRGDMFAPMKLPKEDMVLKPMSCPHHISVYNYKKRSYKDLPLRFAEHTILHRYESSGSLTGLERVRTMELTDSHIFARQDQVKYEFIRCFNLIQEVLNVFNIKISYLSLSLRDVNNKAKYFDDDLMWNQAEAELEAVLKELNLDYKKVIGEAAFYGPKLDIQATTAIGHEITVSTIQLDFLLPQKFDLSYIDSDSTKKRPVMIHRGLIGTYERFIAVLLEQTKGILPLWCAPKQVEIIPINLEENIEYAKKVREELKKHLIRSEINIKDERLSYKIRESQIHKTPFQIVLGKKEQTEEKITYRKYGSEEQITIKLTEFINMLKKQIDSKEFNY